METPHETRGLSFSVNWSGAAGRRTKTLQAGSLFRVAFGVALCAACFQTGRWVGRLDESAPAPASAVVMLERSEAKPLPEKTGDAPGGPVGEKDVITPLNARDPSALVMAPYAPPPLEAAPVPSPKTYRRIKDIKPSRRF